MNTPPSYKSPSSRSSLSFHGFTLKSENAREEFACPMSPMHHNKSRCFTTGHKPIVQSRNLNFLQAPRFYEDFTEICTIGHGEYSTVFKVLSRHDQQHYAIKKFKRPCRGVKDRKKYLDEASKLALLSNEGSEHIVKYIDSWEEDSRFYIRTELCENSLLDCSELTEDALWKVLFDAAQGLLVIHSCNFIHLDVKPANLFVARGRVKIGDFGHMVPAGAVVLDEGDITYAAPEVLLGSACFESDVFSLGLVLFELATGVVMPESGPLWHSIRQNSVPLGDLQFSTQLTNVILRMTHPLPCDRISIEEILNIQGTPIILRTVRFAQSALPVYQIYENNDSARPEVAMNLLTAFNSHLK